MNFEEFLDDASQSFTRNGELVLNKLDKLATEFHEDAIRPINEDFGDLASKWSRDLGVFVRQMVDEIDEIARPTLNQIDIFLESVNETLIKPAGQDLRNLNKELGISEEMRELYKVLGISSEEEVIQIFCAFAAAGGMTALLIFVISYLQNDGRLENFSFFSFMEKKPLLDDDIQRQFNAILEQIEHQRALSVWNQHVVQETYKIKTPTNQFFIERQINNPGLNVSDNLMASNLFALPLIVSYLDKVFEIAQLAFGRIVDMDTVNNQFQGTYTTIGTFANEVKDNARQQANQYIFEKKQTLAEAACEIQRLLKQLEETNPAATEPEQIVYVNVATKPDLKQRTIAALKEGGETAIEEFFLENKYLKVGKAIIKGWLQGGT
ncbi:hypothetical protein [Nostoc sp. CENA543]|uniref:hypothetical protein n=1 Tax=Nostoc sp. CENA543 TaxID=1869241 RepID=UPI001CEF59A2|nr:hypothetical protein [Nostoc sp. CENA543]